MTPIALDSPIHTRKKRHHHRCECERDTLDSPWKAELCTILHTGDEEKAQTLLDDFLNAHHGEIEQVIKRVQYNAHLDYRDRVTPFSYFGQALLQMITNRWRAKDREGTTQVFNHSHNLPSILEMETRYCVREDRKRGLLDGSAGLPGGSAHERKKRLLDKSRQLFEDEKGHAATDDEIVAFHNERMLATRKDAARQSVLITLKDLRTQQAVPLDDASLASEERLTSVDRPDIGAFEREQRLQTLFALCERRDREVQEARTRPLKRDPVHMADVARAYFARHLEGEYPTRRELVEELGATESLRRREVGSQLNAVLQLARTVFSDYRED
ncbi:hypothetical protein [Brachybacterium kimchii]|uniref:Uncharacterized protein n=1 Tax=Brachybacterium kimchii TaxID=2942909 RepID=A0ABY4NAQ3_9MICO|nr:hypothetical protein [Brachybacterium kimchii]UQN30455.1 hypothetical protein M4486_03695 [Brachybacterium kimchii]